MLLLSMYGIDEEDVLDTNIIQESKSCFMDLINMEDDELLDQFINNEEPRYYSKQKMARKINRAQMSEENFEPEDAFMNINFGLRQALKKRPPMGMLEDLEESISERFVSNPQTEYVCEDLSSFERLLVHAICAYNSLNSHSFDFAGRRLLRVENPFSTFFKRNPGLTSYLVMRKKSS